MEQIRKANPNATPEQLEELQTRLVNATQKQLIADLDAKQAADPIFREDEGFIDGLLSPTRWGPYLAGIMTGAAGPESLTPLGVGSKIGTKLGTAFGIEAGADSVYQGLEIMDDVRDEFSALQMALAGGTGAALRGTAEGIGWIGIVTGKQSPLRLQYQRLYQA